MPTHFTHAEIEALRSQAPGTRTTVHFNHAGASLPSSATLRAITEHLEREATLGPMEAGVAAAEHAGQARTLAAALIHARPDEIALTGGVSFGWGAAFAALGNWRAGDRILAGRHEWGGNLAAMYLAAQQNGASVEVIPSTESGEVDPDALAAMLDERVRLIALTWLPANGGLINPAEAVGRVARSHGIPYFLDAAQAVGQMPVDVEQVGCDVMSAAGRKALRGPRGTGLLYVRRDFLHRLKPALVDRHSAPLDPHGTPRLSDDATRFELAERSVALHCGLANALREALALGAPSIRAQIDYVATMLRERLAGIPSVTLLDDGTERSGLVAFNVAGRDANGLQRELAKQGISIGISGVPYTPLDMRARGLDWVARASVSYLTTEAEIDLLVGAIRTLTH
jgi:selenocysteine lyase/cysteine desulfurase